MSPKNENTRCSGRTKKGEPCRAAAAAGGLCFFHANPNKASELGRLGGRSKRHAGAEMADPLPVLDDAIAVRETAARLIADVYAGKLQPKIAVGLVPLLNLQLRVIDRVNLEERVAKLEKQQAEGKDTGDNDSPIRVLWIGERKKGATKPDGSTHGLDSNKTLLRMP